MKNLLLKNSLLSIILITILNFSCSRSVEDNESIDINSEFSGDTSALVVDTTDYSSLENTGTTTIVCDGSSIAITGNGASYSGTQITISSGGTYIISGQLDEGQLIVDAEEQEPSIVLNGVAITSDDNACIYVKNASLVNIILNAETENTLTDNSSYSDEEQNACIYSKSDLVLNGTGTLTVNANYNDGITSKDGLLIIAGSYTIDATDDGIRGKDYLYIQDGSFNITAGGDALKSDNEDDGMGDITITTGDFTLNSECDGIDANYELYIADGTFDITTSGGSSSSFSTSAKGLKSSEYMSIKSGTFTMNTADDAIHSDMSLLIEGGDFNIASGDDAFHADESLTINGGNGIVTEAYEGIESKVITIESGNYYITSSDDGINAADGSSSSSGPSSGGTAGVYLYINGGYIMLNAQGDAFDCNGTAAMTGGSVLIHGPTADNNGPIDYDGTFTVTGGTLVAAGSAGMAEAPGSSSSQNSILCYFTSTLSAETLVHLENEAGESLMTFSSKKSFASIVFSLSELEIGENYNIYYGGSSTGENVDGVIVGGEYTGGTLLETFTLSSTTTTVGTSSSSSSGPGRR